MEIVCSSFMNMTGIVIYPCASLSRVSVVLSADSWEETVFVFIQFRGLKGFYFSQFVLM